MTTATTAAGAAPGQESGREHKQPGVRIRVAGLTRGERGGMGGEDLGTTWVIEAETTRMRLGESARRRLFHDRSLAT